MYYIVLYLVG